MLFYNKIKVRGSVIGGGAMHIDGYKIFARVSCFQIQSFTENLFGGYS